MEGCAYLCKALHIPCPQRLCIFLKSSQLSVPIHGLQLNVYAANFSITIRIRKSEEDYLTQITSLRIHLDFSLGFQHVLSHHMLLKRWLVGLCKLTLGSLNSNRSYCLFKRFYLLSLVSQRRNFVQVALPNYQPYLGKCK